MPLKTLVEVKVPGSAIDVTIKVQTPDEPTPQLAILAAVLDQAMLVAAQNVLVPELKKALSVEGPPASEPYTPPHQWPGASDRASSGSAESSDDPPLIDSIGAWAFPDGGIAVGSVNKYGLFLEIGTQNMAPRPWLVPTLTRSDVINAFNAEVQKELTRLLAEISGDSAPAQPSNSGAPTT
jgi:hypothetical protein